MTSPPIYVTRPALPALDEYIPMLEEIWRSGHLTNAGPFHEQLESALCDYLGVEYISLFSNGTLALLTALKALDVSGEVITTPYSFVVTSHALLWNNLKPRFADIDPISLNIDPDSIRSLITKDTTAILPVHCYGTPCDVDEIAAIARENNLRLIYDAAHAFGVRCHCGSLLQHGDLSVLSFHATKVFNTAEGGAIVCKDKETKLYIDQLKNFGFVDEVTVVETGINGKMNELQAALGLLQLKQVDADIAARREIEAWYRQELRDIPGIKLLSKPESIAGNSAYFPIFITPEFRMSRDQLYDHMRSLGVFARRYFYPLISDFPMYRELECKGASELTNAKLASERVLCLPIYPGLDELGCQRVIDAILF